MVLIDTSSWTQALRRKGDADVRERVVQLVTETEGAWCDIVRLELWNGARSRDDRNTLRKMEDELPTLAMTAEVWNAACNIGSYARAKGLNVPTSDLLVFACAHVHGTGLEHNDQHFDRIGALLGGSRMPERR